MAGLTSRDRRDDADLVAVFYWRGFFLLEADVLVIDENIYKAPDISVLVANALEQARVAGIKIAEDLADGGAFGGYKLLLVCELAERGWYADLGRHWYFYLEIFNLGVGGWPDRWRPEPRIRGGLG